MCGICGYIDYRSGIEGRRGILEAMNGLMSHRGPDGDGLHLEGNVGLGHRRLSIIDLSGGAQPMGNAEGTLQVVFNGEIYNYRELRKELSDKGFPFRTNSDTEVIIQGYAAYGDGVISRLEGMFAFALWDARKKRMLVARDRLGKKPLYYHAGKDRFLFASEMKSLLAEPAVPRVIDPQAVDQYFSYGYIPAPSTIFKDIAKLRPGHFLVWENERIRVASYWDVRYGSGGTGGPGGPARSEDDYADELQAILEESVRKRLISDVPLGAFLSGGLDSSVVVAMMAKIAGANVKTFTIGFEEQGFSEAGDARLVSDTFATEHHEFTVKADALSILPDLVWHFDEPFADSSAVPTYYVSKMAKSQVTVVLSGDGGDELFAGYKNYSKSNALERYRAIPRFVRERLFGAVGASLPLSAPGKFWLLEQSRLEWAEEFPLLELFPPIKAGLFSEDLMRRARASQTAESSLRYWSHAWELPRMSRMQYLDTKVYLGEDILMKVDKMSMAASLETRAPLLDRKLVEFAASVPPEMQMKDGSGKYLLRKVAARILPDAILKKKKQGFAIPQGQWFRKELRDFTRETLTSKRFAARGYFRQQSVEAILREHAKGRRDYSHWLWALVNFELWHQLYVDPDTRRI